MCICADGRPPSDINQSQAELHLPKLLDKDGRLIRVEDANGGWWQLRYR